MSEHEQHDNSGILFRNDKKTRDTDRDYGGSATIAGVEYWVSGWIKEGQEGEVHVSIADLSRSRLRYVRPGAPSLCTR